jgi:hypothetical protein
VRDIYIGVAVFVLTTILGGLISHFSNVTIFQLIGGTVSFSPPTELVVQDPQGQGSDAKKDTESELGEHDLCMLSSVNIQSKTGYASCWLTHNGRAWTLHAEKVGSGAQSICSSMCAAIK